MTKRTNILTVEMNLGSYLYYNCLFCFKLIGSRGVTKTDVLELDRSRGVIKQDVLQVDKVLQEYM